MLWKLAGSAGVALLLVTSSGTDHSAQAFRGGLGHGGGGFAHGGGGFAHGGGGFAHGGGHFFSGGFRSFSPGLRTFHGAGIRPFYGGGVRPFYRAGPQHFAFDHHHFHHHFRHHRFFGAPFVALGAYPLYGDYGDYGYYGDGCYWLRERALVTGSPYWLGRYEDCSYGYDY